MTVRDPDQAATDLAALNYYRLAAYWLPFEEHHETHKFRENTTFEMVKALYVMDRSLRLLMLDAIERIEVAVRARWSYEMAHAHGPHAHLEANLAHRLTHYWRNCIDLSREFGRSEEVFARHLREKYVEPLPPVWAVCELMSFGLLSRWYANLGPQKTRKRISSAFDLDPDQLGSWLHHLSIVRNICAHHSRLWNREFTVTPAAPKTKPDELINQWNTGSRRLYNTLLMTIHFVGLLAPGGTWSSRLKQLLAPLPDDLLRPMGFPTDSTLDDLFAVAK